MLLLDTSALSMIMHRIPGALSRLRQIEPWSVILCSPVAAEIHYGLANLVEGSRRRRLLEEAYRSVRSVARWVDWDERAALQFGRIKAELRQTGTMIQDLDIAIASVAMTLGTSVATRNARHFECITGLPIEDWDSLK